MRSREAIFTYIDWTTVLIWLALMLIGWVSIYAAVYNEAHESIFDISQNYGKQLLWIATALLLAGIILLIDIKFFPAFAYVIYGLSVATLIVVLFMGSVISGSKSWFQIGPFAFQPAEFAKYAVALALARIMSSNSFDFRNLRSVALAFLLIGFPMVLILLQNDTGSALVFTAFIIPMYREGFTGRLLLLGIALIALAVFTLYFGEIPVIITCAAFSLLMLLFIRRNRSNILKLLALLILAVAFIHTVEYSFENFLQAHQKARINVILGKEFDPRGVGYNLNQSKIAIGSGGLTGKGFLQGTQTRYSFVPEQSTDFIFCTIGEEWGFAGSMALIGLFVALLTRLVFLAERQRSDFSRIYGYSVAAVIFFHFAINIGMTIGLVPVIGIPLPFVSYGGSSLWAFSIMLFTFIKQDANRLALL